MRWSSFRNAAAGSHLRHVTAFTILAVALIATATVRVIAKQHPAAPAGAWLHATSYRGLWGTTLCFATDSR